MSSSLFRAMAKTNIRNNRKFYIPFLLTVIFTVMMFFNMCSISKNPAFIKNSAVEYILLFGVVVIGIFALIFIFYTNSFLMKRRKKELSLYHILGLEQKHVGHILTWETLIIGVMGIGNGLILGLVFDRLMFLAILKAFRYEMEVSYRISFQAIVVTAALFAGIFLLILISNIHQINKTSAIELLKGGNIGEREPKSKGLLAALGFVCLAAGYYIAITRDNISDALGMFLVAVLLVAAGTYFLFLAGSIAVLKFLKKRKNYYYKTNHFVAVSGMIYRMKQNAVGLANICILSTGVLLVVSTTVCLSVGIQDILKSRYPTEILASYENSTIEDREKLETAAAEVSEELGLTMENYQAYQSLNIIFQQEDNSLLYGGKVRNLKDMAAATFLTAGDYEKLSGEPMPLEDGEAAVYTEKGFLEDTFEIFGKTYQIKMRPDYFKTSNDYAHTVPRWYSIVVKDNAVLEKIYQQQEAAGGGGFPIKFQMQFDLSGEEADSEEFYRQLQAQFDGEERRPSIQCRYISRKEVYQLYSSMLFLGIYLGVLFLMATVLIIYYKQIAEGYEDKERYRIMKKVGMDKGEIRRSIRSQILILFFLPLGTALLHCAAAFPLMLKIMSAFYMYNTVLFATVTVATAGVFALVYILVYSLTAKTYYEIVS